MKSAAINNPKKDHIENPIIQIKHYHFPIKTNSTYTNLVEIALFHDQNKIGVHFYKFEDDSFHRKVYNTLKNI